MKLTTTSHDRPSPSLSSNGITRRIIDPMEAAKATAAALLHGSDSSSDDATPAHPRGVKRRRLYTPDPSDPLPAPVKSETTAARQLGTLLNTVYEIPHEQQPFLFFFIGVDSDSHVLYTLESKSHGAADIVAAFESTLALDMKNSTNYAPRIVDICCNGRRKAYASGVPNTEARHPVLSQLEKTGTWTITKLRDVKFLPIVHGCQRLFIINKNFF